ncbi:hypothetical protein GWI33_015353 [Rhynchophorus ferrugineus]|uniref:SWIM-type domain-containing protein n=1 Tax=Rhynchophorus ferrugineus TaxID=354439 RepID=A0A834I3H8_RHYFE|nr:hypothetical protein GWI33_015353 [Rhynchophorus ferrugineus]
MADYYYDAWTAIMEKADSRLYCTWHVDRTWRENLSKISSKETQSIIYKQLRTMMQETNEKIFKRMLESVLTSISNQPEIKTFYDYFMKNYSNNTNNWAYCYRVQNGLTTNMHIEQMHRSIKYLFLDGKHTKRLDKAITAITKFCRDKLLEQLVIMNKGRLCSKISSIRTRHKISESLNFEDIVSVGGGWQVVSTSTEYYIHEENNACKCNLMCSNCGICLHRYSCSCLDSTIKWNMCKHIHLLGRYLKTFSADGEHVNTDILHEPETETKAHVLGESSFATESPLNRICPPSMKDPFIASKKQVHDMLLHTESLLEKCKTVSQLDVIKNALRPIETTLNALECKKECIDPDEEYMLT